MARTLLTQRISAAAGVGQLAVVAPSGGRRVVVDAVDITLTDAAGTIMFCNQDGSHTQISGQYYVLQGIPLVMAYAAEPGYYFRTNISRGLWVQNTAARMEGTITYHLGVL